MGDYDLTEMVVLHAEHPFQNDPGDASAAVMFGFDWAMIGEGQGIFLCRDTGPCLAPDECAKTFWFDRPEEPAGHRIELQMPWPAPGDDSGALEVFELWCCENCTAEGTGATFDVWVGRFYDLPARLLSYLHETRSHTYTGLRKAMGERYPDRFSEASFVTLVLYRRTL
jgi:hypothetical protein